MNKDLIDLWRHANALSEDEALAIKECVVRSTTGAKLDFGWWRACLSNGLEPMIASVKFIQPALMASWVQCR